MIGAYSYDEGLTGYWRGANGKITTYEMYDGDVDELREGSVYRSRDESWKREWVSVPYSLMTKEKVLAAMKDDGTFWDEGSLADGYDPAPPALWR
jgi:hypothetical protein